MKRVPTQGYWWFSITYARDSRTSWVPIVKRVSLLNMGRVSWLRQRALKSEVSVVQHQRRPYYFLSYFPLHPPVLLDSVMIWCLLCWGYLTISFRSRHNRLPAMDNKIDQTCMATCLHYLFKGQVLPSPELKRAKNYGTAWRSLKYGNPRS